MKIQSVQVSKLDLECNRVRTHEKTSVDAIAKSLHEFGQTKPIVVGADNKVWAGRGTVLAAQQLGWKKLHANIKPDWSDVRGLAYSVADNKTGDISKPVKSEIDAAIAEINEYEADLVYALGYQQDEVNKILIDLENDAANGATATETTDDGTPQASNYMLQAYCDQKQYVETRDMLDEFAKQYGTHTQSDTILTVIKQHYMATADQR